MGFNLHWRANGANSLTPFSNLNTLVFMTSGFNITFSANKIFFRTVQSHFAIKVAHNFH